MTPVKSRVRVQKAKTKKSAQYWNQLVRSDVQVQKDWADSTKSGVQTMQKNFEQYEAKSIPPVIKHSPYRFTALLDPKEPSYWLKNLDIKAINASFRWYLDNHEVHMISTNLDS